MTGFQFADKLLLMPLFQGLSRTDLENIIGQTKFGFDKHLEGDVIAKADTACNQLIFILSGRLQVVTTAADHSYCMTETLAAPLQLQPERLFGMRMHYTSTFRAVEQCSSISLSKIEVVKLFNNYEVFRLNLLNATTAQLQKHIDSVWSTQTLSLRKRIVQFLLAHSLRPAGEKHMKIKMTTLAQILNDTRINVSIELNRLQADGLIHLSRGMIHIPQAEKLLA